MVISSAKTAEASARVSLTESPKTLHNVSKLPSASTEPILHNAQYGGLQGVFLYATQPFLISWAAIPANTHVFKVESRGFEP